ncbi:hypothetical protein [Streptomyces sp. NPDC008125]|uniref:hypothetical protein n=1 Tax=Streptomyces sp. NPDC008125 TaxID=3364811 RepID=UPI0036E5D2FB
MADEGRSYVYEDQVAVGLTSTDNPVRGLLQLVDAFPPYFLICETLAEQCLDEVTDRGVDGRLRAGGVGLVALSG